MTLWEHQVLHLPIDALGTVKMLDEQGAKGWELVSYHRFMAPRRAHAQMLVEAVFKRPREESQDGRDVMAAMSAETSDPIEPPARLAAVDGRALCPTTGRACAVPDNCVSQCYLVTSIERLPGGHYHPGDDA